MPDDSGSPGLRWPAAVLKAGLLAGALDLAAALTLNLDQGPVTTLQAIASGLMGPSAFQGGRMTALVGAALHFGIMLAIAGLWTAAALRLAVMRRRWMSAGAVWGALVWAAMSLIVVPLSAAPFGVADDVVTIAQGLAVHVAFVGWPMAWVTRRRATPRAKP